MLACPAATPKLTQEMTQLVDPSVPIPGMEKLSAWMAGDPDQSYGLISEHSPASDTWINGEFPALIKGSSCKTQSQCLQIYLSSQKFGALILACVLLGILALELLMVWLGHDLVKIEKKKQARERSGEEADVTDGMGKGSKGSKTNFDDDPIRKNFDDDPHQIGDRQTSQSDEPRPVLPLAKGGKGSKKKIQDEEALQREKQARRGEVERTKDRLSGKHSGPKVIGKPINHTSEDTETFANPASDSFFEQAQAKGNKKAEKKAEKKAGKKVNNGKSVDAAAEIVEPPKPTPPPEPEVWDEMALVSRKRETANTSMFVFTHDGKLTPPAALRCTWHITVGMERDGEMGLHKRNYSPISCTSNAVKLLIKNYPEGNLSKHIHNMEPGGTLAFNVKPKVYLHTPLPTSHTHYTCDVSYREGCVQGQVSVEAQRSQVAGALRWRHRSYVDHAAG